MEAFSGLIIPDRCAIVKKTASGRIRWTYRAILQMSKHLRVYLFVSKNNHELFDFFRNNRAQTQCSIEKKLKKFSN